jgi:hypothetical protein
MFSTESVSVSQGTGFELPQAQGTKIALDSQAELFYGFLALFKP